MDNSRGSHRGHWRGGPRGGARGGDRGGSRGGRSNFYRGSGRGRGGNSQNTSAAGATSGMPRGGGHPGAGPQLQTGQVNQQGTNLASSHQHSAKGGGSAPTGSSPAGTKQNLNSNRPKGGNGLFGQAMKRKERFDEIIAEKRRRFESGEQTVRVKDEFEYESMSAPGKGGASSSMDGGERLSGLDDENPSHTPLAPLVTITSPKSSGESLEDEDVQMDDSEYDEVEKVKYFLCRPLFKATKECIGDEQATWRKYDNLVHIFSEYATTGNEDHFLQDLKSLRDKAAALLQGQTHPLDTDILTKRTKLSFDIHNLEPEDLMTTNKDMADPIPKERKVAAMALNFRADVESRLGKSEQDKIPYFQQTCTTAVSFWTADISYFSDVKDEHKPLLQEVLAFSNGLTQQFASLHSDHQAAHNQINKMDIIIKDALTRSALEAAIHSAKTQAQASCDSLLKRRSDVMTSFKRKYIKLWNVSILAGKMDKDAFLKTWEMAHLILLGILEIPEDNEVSYFYTVYDLPEDDLMGGADENMFENLFA